MNNVKVVSFEINRVGMTRFEASIGLTFLDPHASEDGERVFLYALEPAPDCRYEVPGIGQYEAWVAAGGDVLELDHDAYRGMALLKNQPVFVFAERIG